MRLGRARVPVTVLAALLVAEGAALLLRPRGGVIDPAPVNAHSYFSDAQIQRARDYRRPQLLLYVGGIAAEGALLVFLIRRPPRRLRGPFRRPVVAAAGAGAALSVALTVVPLPFDAIARQRALDVGLVTQSWGGWAEDLVKSTAIGSAIAAVGGALAFALIRRSPRRWWMPASVAIVVFGAGTQFAGPVLLDPVFNKFTKLQGPVREDVLAVARRAHVKVGKVYEMDASRRTTAVNAYVAGFGGTKRVVIYDTLLNGFTRDETREVVAHELGHVHYRDVPRGLLFLLLVTPLGVLAVQRLTERMAPGEARPAVLPALVLSLAVVSFPITVIGNGLSRRIEARADSFALHTTGDPAPFISFQRKITLRNIGDPDPPKLVQFLFGDHPTAVERIGAGLAYERHPAG